MSAKRFIPTQNALAVGTVTVAGMTVTGITTTDDDVKLTVDIGNLDINQAIALGAGDLLLDVTGNVAQAASITAGGLGLMVDGTTTLNNAANNVATIAANNGGETQYTDANTLTVGAVTVAGMTVTGITTTNDDVKLTVNIGNLDINQAVALGTGDLLLDVTGNVAQTATITANGLALMVDGTTTLTAANNVATIAANNGGETVYTDANVLAVGSVTVAGMTVTGITTTDDDVKLTVDVGNLNINQAVRSRYGRLTARRSRQRSSDSRHFGWRSRIDGRWNNYANQRRQQCSHLRGEQWVAKRNTLMQTV